ncbi:MAG: KTSC domain-containing protein [Planctomycetota bacterium]|nr:KTSC domain-containing protein [Planctomycetota bacterium]
MRSAFIRKLALRQADDYGEIHVTMERRITYVYEVPEPSYWYNFKAAPSKGRYYNAVIKRRFDYVRKY